MNKPEFIRTSSARLWRNPQGIMRGKILALSMITPQQIQENIEVLRQLHGLKASPLLLDIRLVQMLPHQEARTLFRNPDVVSMLSAVAFWTDSNIGIMMVNFFIRVSRPPFPVRAFQKEEKALAWLEQFLPTD